MSTSENSPIPARTRRWLLRISLVLALIQGAAIYNTLTRPAELDAQAHLSRPIELAAGILWALIFTFIAFTLLQRKRHALRIALWGLMGFALYSVARLALFAQAEYDRQRLPFLFIVMTLFLLVLTAFLRYYSRSRPP